MNQPAQGAELARERSVTFESAGLPESGPSHPRARARPRAISLARLAAKGIQERIGSARTATTTTLASPQATDGIGGSDKITSNTKPRACAMMEPEQWLVKPGSPLLFVRRNLQRSTASNTFQQLTTTDSTAPHRLYEMKQKQYNHWNGTQTEARHVESGVQPTRQAPGAPRILEHSRYRSDET